MRAWTLAAFLLIAGGLVVAGVARIHGPSGLITAGLLLAGWAFLILSEARE